MSQKRAAKSYWQSVYVDSDNAKRSVASWFAPLSDGMTVYKAEILCDIETDDEKKIRAFMKNDEGKRYRFIRTKGRNFTVSMEPWPK